MQYLPTADEQTWLIDELMRLLRARGANQFLSMPLVEPTPRFFPDPWSFSIEGLDRVVRRLMQYAGLGDLGVRIGTFADPGLTTTKERLECTSSVAGVFLGLESGCAYFAFNETAPADSEYMAGVMAHEVTHAYRTLHRLSDEVDREREERLTDLTGTYLGFGLLLANNSYRYRTFGAVEGILSSHGWTAQRAGYLNPQAFAYLLAIQMEARGLDGGGRKRLLRHLEANQAAFTEAAGDSILQWPEEDPRRLLFPPAGDTITEVPLELVLVPLPEILEAADKFEPSVEDVEAAKDLFNLGRPVFRLTKSRALAYSLIGLFVGVVLGAFLVALSPSPWVVGPAVAGFALGWVRGSREREDICADPECETPLAPDAATCPGCGGLVAGSIRRPSERLAAAEEYELKHKRKRRGRPMKRR